ncbi:MAG: nitrogenase component 1, partial [Thiobacillus sp.]|nr:nitrogenase component 1 [Thiobacillus sp.]
VSGDAAKNAWLARVDAAWQNLGLPADLPPAAAEATGTAAVPVRIDAPAVGQRVAPPAANPVAAGGELFHACLEAHAPPGAPRDLSALAARLGLEAELDATEAAARALLAQPRLAHLFDPARYRRAHNEWALLDADGHLQRLDRVVEFDDAVWLIDYKTGDDSRALSDAQLVERHRAQLAGYRSLLAELHAGKPVHAALLLADGRLVDMMTDSHTWLHGKRFALYGDPDFTMGMVKFLMELGAEPVHVVCNNGSKKWNKAMQKLLESSPYGVNCKAYPGADLWHLRSLVFTDKPDFIIGNSYGKFIQRDTLHKGKEFEVPLIRLGFPIFDRHHLHRMTTLGYEGAMYMLTTLVNAVLERLDEETRGMGTTDYNYDLIR